MGHPVVGDIRDEQTWVAIRLTHAGEVLVDEGRLVKTLRRDLHVEDDFPIFVPTAFFMRDGRTISVHLMEGYVFVGTGLAEVQYFGLENRSYIEEVMSVRSGPHRIRYVSVIKNAHVKRMQDQLHELVSADIPLKAHVIILDGHYKGLEGVVVGVRGQDAFVHIRLRSLEVVATVPKIFLDEKHGNN